jgi:hypothetical protein
MDQSTFASHPLMLQARPWKISRLPTGDLGDGFRQIKPNRLTALGKMLGDAAEG